MLESWRGVFSGAGWGRRTRPRPEGDGDRRGAARARYAALRASGLGALAGGDTATAIEMLAMAAAIQPRSAEAHESLARALRDAGKIEAARHSVLVAQERGCSTPDLERLLAELPPPPPCRGNFEKGHVLYSSLTGNRWTVLDRRLGGFGAVYKVRDHEDGRIHALKTFQSKFLWSEADRNRFIREASTWIRLDPHPNIVSAEWIETIEEFPCVVQEFIEGGDVADMLATQTLTIQRVLELAIQFCDGMGFAHNLLGIVHRDIKSSNCLLTSAGTLKIGDFGLARTFDESRTSALDLIGIDPATRVQFTVPLGTWSYMAPEQLDPEANLDTRTDIHGFGVMLYEMLTRDLPAYYSQDEPDQGLQRGWLAYEYISLSVDRFRVPKNLWRAQPHRSPQQFRRGSGRVEQASAEAISPRGSPPRYSGTRRRRLLEQQSGIISRPPKTRGGAGVLRAGVTARSERWRFVAEQRRGPGRPQALRGGDRKPGDSGFALP